MLLLLLALIFASAAVGGEFSTQSDIVDPNESLFSTSEYVVDLDSINLRKVHPEATRCPWLVLFYHSGCGHCRTLAPHYAAFALRNSGEKKVIQTLFGAVDCRIHEDLCLAQKIHDVPELFLAAGREPLRLYSLNVTTDFEVATSQTKELLDKLHSHHSAAAPVCRAIQHVLSSVKHKHIVASGRHLAFGNQSARHPATPFVEDTNFHAGDVAGAFYYTMWYEVPTVPLVGTARKALCDFLFVVSSTLPGLKAEVLLAVLNEPASNLTPAAWKDHVTAAAIPHSRRGTDVEWTTCRGSSWKFRGFPCGMWLLYHTLLTSGSPLAGFAKLQAIRGYVVQFFTCADCRSHFAQFKFEPRQDAALQLWRAHNAVNKRLAPVVEGADPLVKKVQFPPRWMCVSCYNGDSFIESEVVHFLRARYRWNASELSGNELECDSEGDVCLLKSNNNGAMTPTPPFKRRNRDPNFTFHIDDAAVNVFLTSAVVVIAVGSGFLFGVRRRRRVVTHDE